MMCHDMCWCFKAFLKAQCHLLSNVILRLRNNIIIAYFDLFYHALANNCRDFRGISRIEPYYKTPLLPHKCDSCTPTKSHRSAGNTVPLNFNFCWDFCLLGNANE